MTKQEKILVERRFKQFKLLRDKVRSSQDEIYLALIELYIALC